MAGEFMDVSFGYDALLQLNMTFIALPGLPINRYVHFIILIVILDGALRVHCNRSGYADRTQ